MTSAQNMLTGRIARAAVLTAMTLSIAGLGACERKTLTSPVFLEAPYAEPQTWAVAPFLNESGVSDVKGDRIADFMAEQAQQVYGIDTIPVNRVLLAMRKHGIASIASEGDARLIMNTLDVDGLLVGTVTSYDAYRPPKLGLATQLFVREHSNLHRTIDPQKLQKSTSGEISPGEIGPAGAVAQAAGVFDASNHQTLLWLQNYATGRTEPDTAYGSDIYLVDMDLYTQFVCFRLLQDLLAHEYARVLPPIADEG